MMVRQETMELQNPWDELYEADPEHFGSRESEFAIKCSKVMRDYRVNKILDIGCGYGRDSIFFGRQGFKVAAMDYSQKATALLNEKISDISLEGNVSAVCCDICKGIPFDDGYFDVIYSFLLFPVGFTDSQIEYVFSDIHRVLRADGLFLSCVRIDVSSFFSENYLRSKLGRFRVENLVTKNILVKKYHFNVIEFIARKGGQDGGN